MFVWFDSLRPINNLSVIKGRSFLGWTNTKLGLMFLLKDTTQWHRWGSNPRPFVSSQALYHWATALPNATYQVSRSLALWFWRKFLRFLPYMGMAAIFVMWTKYFDKFWLTYHKDEIWVQLGQRFVAIWNLSLICPVVSEEMFENVDGRTTDGHTPVWLVYY